ncbi:MAG: hypothetical protein HYY65_12570 [Candidatus Tectomicrobia bacterium]|uniref:Uncharacterized protein n=1 Tax=Tectimicrobiota bacterium TaxID=2528274 RepID=A0A932GRQ9_UNCTE|nr:hypothetical protein [Candidatus Tectomicrobia bacterium]
MSADEKLQGYMELAEELRSFVKDTKDKILLQVQGQQLSWRNRVLIGFGLKMSDTFECLVEDVQKNRPEAFHHLKTLVECFIYLHWVVQKTDDTRAKLVIAEGIRQKITFLQNVGNFAN